jgi:hypothetical protein
MQLSIFGCMHGSSPWPAAAEPAVTHLWELAWCSLGMLQARCALQATRAAGIAAGASQEARPQLQCTKQCFTTVLGQAA